MNRVIYSIIVISLLYCSCLFRYQYPREWIVPAICEINVDGNYDREVVLNQIADSLNKALPDYAKQFRRYIHETNKNQKPNIRVKGIYVENEYLRPIRIFDLVDSINTDRKEGKIRCIDIIDHHIYLLTPHGLSLDRGRKEELTRHVVIPIDGRLKFYYFIESNDSTRNQLDSFIKENMSVYEWNFDNIITKLDNSASYTPYR